MAWKLVFPNEFEKVCNHLSTQSIKSSKTQITPTLHYAKYTIWMHHNYILENILRYVYIAFECELGSNLASFLRNTIFSLETKALAWLDPCRVMIRLLKFWNWNFIK